MATAKKTQKQATEINQAAINRVTDKATHLTYYTVKSDSQADTWYEVRFDEASHQWRCNCPSHKPCKHERAVNQVLLAKYREGAAKQAAIAKAESDAYWGKVEQARREAAPISSARGQGFSLMR